MRAMILVVPKNTSAKSVATRAARFRCTATDTAYVSNDSLIPFSPFTGEQTVEKISAKKLQFDADAIQSEASYLTTCPSCEMDIYMNTKAARIPTVEESLFCPVCATDLHAEENIPDYTDKSTLRPTDESVDNVDPTLEQADTSTDNDNQQNLEQVTTMQGETESDMTPNNPYEVNPQAPAIPSTAKKRKNKKRKKNRDKNRPGKAEEKLSKIDEGEDVGKKGNSEAEEPPKIDDTNIDQPQDQGLSGDGTSDDNTDVFDSVTGVPVSASKSGNTVKVNMFAAVKDIGEKELDFVPVTSSVAYLFADQRPVMIFNRSNAAESLKSLYDAPQKFFEAVTAAIQTKSFKPADFGGEPMVIRVPVKSSLKQEARNSIKAQKQKIESTLKTLSDSYFDALCVASVAVTKNVVTGKENPVKASLVTEMENVGVREPEKIVDRVFASAGKDMMRQIVDYAREYMDKSDDAKSEITRFVSQASYNPMNAGAGDDDNSARANQLADDLAGNNIPITSRIESMTAGMTQSTTAGANKDTVASMRNLLRGAR